KGSGVGIWIGNSWTQYLTEVKRPNFYCIKASLRFKKAILSVCVIYIPPNNKNKQKEVQHIITKDIVEKRKKEYFILGRDFNHILDSITDRIGVLTCNKIQKFLLTSWLSK